MVAMTLARVHCDRRRPIALDRTRSYGSKLVRAVTIKDTYGLTSSSTTWPVNLAASTR